MRFEMLDYQQRIKFLQRLHKCLNKELFNNVLLPLVIDVRNLNHAESHITAMYCTADEYQPERILFDDSFFIFDEDGLRSLKTQGQQAEIIVKTMLHEMIHQYCEETGIPQNKEIDHSKEWQQAAKEHGLYSVYDEKDVLIKEQLMIVPLDIAYRLRIH